MVRTFDDDDLKRIGALDWQAAQLKLNPDYVHWGPHEDYMSTKTGGWSTPIIMESWGDGFALDDLNEVVNFYFSVQRDSVQCATCNGTGTNAETAEIERAFYDFEETGDRWCEAITDDEFEALRAEGRHWGAESAAEVNARQRQPIHAHDAINRWILVRARAERLGVFGDCDKCEAKGYIYTEEQTRLALTLWVLHPRKGCSRGVEIRQINEEELPKVYGYLREAAARNAERFSRTPPTQPITG